MNSHEPESGRKREATVEPGGATVPAPLSERVRSLRLPEQIPNGYSPARLPWVLSLLLAAGCVALGLAALRKPSAGPAAAPESADVPAVAPQAGEEITLESKGYVIATHQILVSPQVSGRIVRLHIQEEQRVKKGELLAELESTEYEADVGRAEAMLELTRQRLRELENGFRPEEIKQAEAELAEAEAQLPQLEADWRRAGQLVADKIISQQDYDLAESRHRAMQQRRERLRSALRLLVEGARKERRDAAKAEVQQAEAELRKARWRLDNCRVVAPRDGTILKKNAEEGNIVNPIAFNGSYSICDLADLADLEVDLSIQERDIARIFKGQKCKVRAEAYPDRVYQGVVTRLMPIADRAKGAIPVRVKLSVPAGEEGVYLKPEMSATVSFLK